MAEVQMIQLKGQTVGGSSKTKAGSQSDFSGMLKEVSQSVSGQKKPVETAGDESAKAANRDEIRESGKDKGQITDSEDKLQTEQEDEENTKPAEEIDFVGLSAGLTGQEIAELTGMMASLSQDAQDNSGQQSNELLQAADEKAAAEGLGGITGEEGRMLVEDSDLPAGLAESDKLSVNENGGQLLAADSEAVEMTAESQDQGQAVEIAEVNEAEVNEAEVNEAEVNEAEVNEAEADETVQAESSRDSQVKQGEHSEEAEQTVDNTVSGMAENRSLQTVQPLASENGTAVLKTSPDTLPEDVSETIASKMFAKDAPAELELTLEPASLGKITIKMIYEEGRAAFSLISDNPKTLELLSQKVGEIAQILQEKTGQDTVVYAPEAQYTENDAAKQQSSGRRQEQQERPKQDQTESFMQQLRLGLV